MVDAAETDQATGVAERALADAVVTDLAALVAQSGNDDPRAALEATASARRALERVEAVQVRRARMQGRTWAEIAAALGVSKQAVHKKYRGMRLLRRVD